MQRRVWNNWGIAVFVDSGDAFNGAAPEMKTGAGVGLRWRSPVGPVRIDFASGLDSPPGDAFRFSFQPRTGSVSAPPTSPPAPPSPKRSDNAAAPPAKTPSTLRRVAVWLIGLPLVLLLLAFVLGGIGITTETGLNALLGQAKRFLPGQLSYEKISGRLSGPLHIEGLRYEDGPLTVKLATADFDWQPTALLDRHLNIGRLQFEGLEIHLPPAQETPPSTGPVVLPEIQLPLGITVADLQGRNIRIVPAGAEPIQIDAIKPKAQSTADGLTIETLNIKAPLGEATLSGQINPTGNYPLKLDLVWQAPLAGFGAFQGQGVIEGALRDKLTLTHKVTGPATLELDGEVRRPLGKAAWSAKAKLDVADLKSLVPDLAGKPLTFKLDAAGVMAQFRKGRAQHQPARIGADHGPIRRRRRPERH